MHTLVMKKKRKILSRITRGLYWENKTHKLKRSIFGKFISLRVLIILIRAAKLNHTKIAEILLENGASIEAKNMMDMTPFLIAVAHGAKETVEVLLDRGADLFARDSFHNSGLHLAVMYKRKEMIHTLLKRDKEKLVELRSNDLQTVIHLAARYEEPEVG